MLFASGDGCGLAEKTQRCYLGSLCAEPPLICRRMCFNRKNKSCPYLPGSEALVQAPAAGGSVPGSGCSPSLVLQCGLGIAARCLLLPKSRFWHQRSWRSRTPGPGPRTAKLALPRTSASSLDCPVQSKSRPKQARKGETDLRRAFRKGTDCFRVSASLAFIPSLWLFFANQAT